MFYIQIRLDRSGVDYLYVRFTHYKYISHEVSRHDALIAYSRQALRYASSCVPLRLSIPNVIQYY